MKAIINAEQLRDAVLTLPEVADWPEVGGLFANKVERIRVDWQLPAIACRATGGTDAAAVAASAALACLQISIILIDDILDDDPRGEYHRLGVGRTANLGLAYEAIAMLLIEQAPVSPDQRWSAAKALARAAAATSYGQELDVQNLQGEENYWRVVRAKSTPFYGVAFQLGALLGGANDAIASGLYDLGVLLGEIIQIFDDLLDAFETPANPDWTEGRNNLALLYATKADHVDRDRFLEIRPRARDAILLDEAQKILIRSGAVSFCVYQLLQRYGGAKAILSKLDLADNGTLAQVLADHVSPLARWLETLHIAVPPELLGELK